MRALKLAASLLAVCLTTAADADNARFDLAGPKIDVRVTRGSQTLPIAEVPNLQPGDKIWVKADLPPTQSNHLILVVAFLRGTTNVPPDNWFTEIDTWEKKTAEGTTITVPSEAQQALMFIAPETGGDFKTLRSAVKGRPGLFIRADADLNEASFEQQRIAHYLAAMKHVDTTDAKEIQERSAKLAATLALKPDPDCFKQPVDDQVNCLTISSAPVLMDDGHGQNIAEALSSGAASDFATSVSQTQPLGAGVYSAYVGTVVDLIQIVGMLRTAQYQYIPGLSFPQDAAIDLKLNTPPSFHNPKSVIVVGLPAIQKAIPPPLHTRTPDQVTCLLEPKLVLPLNGAPLVFSTSFAHDLVLHLNRKDHPKDIPLTPDAFEGGLIEAKEPTRRPLQEQNAPAQTKDVKLGSPGDVTVTGTIGGYWGFDRFDGPTVTLQQIDGKDWKIVAKDPLMAGQDAKFTLDGNGTACVDKIQLANDGGNGKDRNVDFKPATDDGKPKKDELALDVSLKEVKPGGYSLEIQQFGDSKPVRVPLTAYDAAIKLDGLKIHAGDNKAVLTGSQLQDVVSVRVGDQTFTPADAGNTGYTVNLQSKAGVSPKDGSDAEVRLKDGRELEVKIVTEAARPSLQLVQLTAAPAQQEAAMQVALGAKDDIPLDGKLVFVVQTKAAFPRSQTIEVATADGSVHTTLSLASNNLVLQDQHTAVATLNPLKAFGESAFGKLEMRPVAADGTTGDWTELGVLVRTPNITAIQCTTEADPSCKAEGDNFFFVQSFAGTKDFSKPVNVPTGYAGSNFTVPTPADGTTLYLKLRDDPSQEASVTLPTPVPPAPAPTPAPTPEPAPAAATPADAPAVNAPVPSIVSATAPATVEPAPSNLPPAAQPASSTTVSAGSTPAAPKSAAPAPASVAGPKTAKPADPPASPE
jgi:hypothetical protein